MFPGPCGPLQSSVSVQFLRAVWSKTVELSARSLDLNAYTERFVRSVKSECLAQIIYHRRAA